MDNASQSEHWLLFQNMEIPSVDGKILAIRLYVLLLALLI
jgi:hypothetical protein